MELEHIRYVNFDEPDRKRVQEQAMKAVRDDPETFIESYRHDARSFGGRYVAADLFKETFPEYSASRESRNRYNNPVHNAAAVLSATLFAANLREPRDAPRDTVYLLTGSPGAGKTSLVLGKNALPADAHMVFEGQMSNFETSRSKVQQVLDAGFRPRIVVVHVRSEDALDKTLERFNEEGRGSSIATIAKIQGGLPDSLTQLGAYFSGSLLLDIADFRDRDNPMQLRGFDNVNVLRSEGTHEHIQQRLEARIDEYRRTARISDAAYRQAAGLSPGPGLRVDSGRDGHRHENVPGRSAPQSGRSPALLDTLLPQARQAGTRFHTPLTITDAHQLPPKVRAAGVRGEVIDVTDKHVLVRTGRTDAIRFARSDIRGEVQVGRRIEMEFRGREQKQPLEQNRGLGKT